MGGEELPHFQKGRWDLGMEEERESGHCNHGGDSAVCWGALPGARWPGARAVGLQGLRRAVGEVPGGGAGDDRAASLSPAPAVSLVVRAGGRVCSVFSLAISSPLLPRAVNPSGRGWRCLA